MSLKINIEIALEAGESYSPIEAAVVAALKGDAAANTAAPAAAPAAAKVTEAPAKVSAPAKTAPAKTAPAKVEKPAPSPKSAQSTTPAVLDTTIDEEDTTAAEAEVDETEEDLVGGSETKYTKQDAIQEATKRISSGQMADVKKALSKVTAKKVSDLNDDEEIQVFMRSLNGEDED